MLQPRKTALKHEPPDARLDRDPVVTVPALALSNANQMLSAVSNRAEISSGVVQTRTRRSKHTQQASLTLLRGPDRPHSAFPAGAEPAIVGGDHESSGERSQRLLEFLDERKREVIRRFVEK